MNRQTNLSRISFTASMAALACVLVTGTSNAEPYLAVFKGMQCSSCHSHPSGGGKRTVYGNAFSQTEMPAERLGPADARLWTGDMLDWLAVGGNLRADYRNVDVPNASNTSEFDVSRATIYIEARLIPNRLSLYIDQQLAPGSSLNREAYLRLNSRDQRYFLAAGQFFLPYGLRLQDDSAFVRLTTGANFTIPDRGLQLGFEAGPWSTQLSVTNGSGGGAENDSGKQVSLVANYVRPLWRVGTSFNRNDTDSGNRQMQNLFAGLKTGPVVWLAEVDLITDDLPGGIERDAIAGLIEGNWLFQRGHNIKLSYDYFDPDDDVSEDHQVRYSIVWEYTPMQFLQGRFGARIYDGIPQVDLQNREEFFAELHGFF